MRSTFKPEDAIILTTDVTDIVEEASVKEREKKKAEGRPYYYDLPVEYVPTPEYNQVLMECLGLHKAEIAKYIFRLADIVYREANKGYQPVLVSLLRAGTPVGALIARCLRDIYNTNIPHYSISIIRGVGLDAQAIRYIQDAHGQGCSIPQLMFVDGWVGKGVIGRELCESMKALRDAQEILPCAWMFLTISDPLGSSCYATTEDIWIPTACLNSTACGLLSRSVYNPDFIDPVTQFHGAKYFREFESMDSTNFILDTIQEEWLKHDGWRSEVEGWDPPRKKMDVAYQENISLIQDLADRYTQGDINFVKPGIGETTRVLLRRIPQCVLYSEALGLESFKERAPHIVRLCEDKHVPIKAEQLGPYVCAGIAGIGKEGEIQ